MYTSRTPSSLEFVKPIPVRLTATARTDLGSPERDFEVRVGVKSTGSTSRLRPETKTKFSRTQRRDSKENPDGWSVLRDHTQLSHRDYPDPSPRTVPGSDLFSPSTP